jgi:RNA polymerase sigma-70 factor (ECF subfamily)
MLATATCILGREDEAADAVQEAMIKLWFFKDRLDSYSSPEAPAAVILRRVCISMLRARKTTSELTDAELIAVQPYEEAIEPELLKAIESLPPMEQAVLKMKHLEDMETDEIAALVGSTPVAVRTALSRARKKVRDIYLNM